MEEDDTLLFSLCGLNCALCPMHLNLVKQFVE